jgi:hypothetical protein
MSYKNKEKPVDGNPIDRFIEALAEFAAQREFERLMKELGDDRRSNNKEPSKRK